MVKSRAGFSVADVGDGRSSYRVNGSAPVIGKVADRELPTNHGTFLLFATRRSQVLPDSLQLSQAGNNPALRNVD